MSQQLDEWITTNTMPGDPGSDAVVSVKLLREFIASTASEPVTPKSRNRLVLTHETRCCAKRCNGERCSRSRKNSTEFCGTHINNHSSGVVDCVDNGIVDSETTSMETVKLFVRTINGIPYYTDKSNRIYKTSNILQNSIKPEVIGQCIGDIETGYSIELCESIV